MIWPFQDIVTSLYIWGLIFNFLLAIVLFRLRVLAEGHPLTKSQRWALTIAGWLYLANSFQIMGDILIRLGELNSQPVFWGYVHHTRSQFNLMATLCLLLLGLVYPALFLRWKRLRFVILGLALLLIPLIFIQFRYDYPVMNALMGDGVALLSLTYLPACFIPIFIWIPLYWKHNSPQLDNILTILIWGYLFNFAVGQTGSFISSIYHGMPSRWNILVMVLLIIAVFLIIKTIYHKRGQWGTAEKIHLTLIGISAVLAIWWAVTLIRLDNDALSGSGAMFGFTTFICGVFGWIILRPILFSYGLLRYQFFGPKVNVAKYFEGFLAVVISSLLAILLAYVLSQYNTTVAMAAAVVLFLVLLYPSFRLSKILITKSLPMSEGGSKAPLTERRSTYLMGLQTAVVEGEIEDSYDVEALEQLRLDLNVSQREHDLLMDGFLRDRPQTMQDELEEAYLFHKNGMLLGYVSREGRQGEGKEGMMAAMLSTVGKFASDALRKGSDSVESIEYGNITLIVETEGDIALGVLLNGKDNPQVRQRMRDVLGSINKEYGKAIQGALKQASFDEMQKAKEKMKGLEGLMRRFLKEGGK